MTSARREIALNLSDVVVGDSFKDDGRDQVVAIHFQDGKYKGPWYALLVHPDPAYINKPKVRVWGSGYETIRVWRYLDIPDEIEAKPLLGAMQEFVDKHGYDQFKELVLEIHTDG